MKKTGQTRFVCKNSAPQSYICTAEVSPSEDHHDDEPSQNLVTASLPPTHPLDPLTADEITLAVSIVTADSRFPSASSQPFAEISRLDPPKSEVYAFVSGPFSRKAFVIVWDSTNGNTYEIVANLNTNSIESWIQITSRVTATVQPPALPPLDFGAIFGLAAENPKIIQALAIRGLTPDDIGNIVVYGFGESLIKNGNTKDCIVLPDAKIPGRFFYFQIRTACGGPRPDFQRGLSCVIPGLIFIYNVITNTIFDVYDQGLPLVTPPDAFPWEDPTPRPAANPICTTQPEGPSFTITGSQVQWQGWSFHIVPQPRNGVNINLVTYEDPTLNIPKRTILYQGSLSETLVIYEDPQYEFATRTGDADLAIISYAQASISLTPGIDTPPYATFLDSVYSNVGNNGAPFTVPNNVAIYEEDDGILYRLNALGIGARGTRLVVKFGFDGGNYDWYFSWVFHQDGRIEVITDALGFSLWKALNQSEEQFGRLVFPRLVNVNHQHFFNYRLDFDIDGVDADTPNSIIEENFDTLQSGRNCNVKSNRRVDHSNPCGNGTSVTETVLTREKDAVRDINPFSSRSWKITNPSSLNYLGQPRAYSVRTNDCIKLLTSPSSYPQKYFYANHNVVGTKFHPNELYAGGAYQVQTPEDTGLGTYIANNESLVNTDVVLWVTVGFNHHPRPEDFPLMPPETVTIKIEPDGFFDRNPGWSVPQLPLC
jgi:primary-amine oxidase